MEVNQLGSYPQFYCLVHIDISELFDNNSIYHAGQDIVLPYFIGDGNLVINLAYPSLVFIKFKL